MTHVKSLRDETQKMIGDYLAAEFDTKACDTCDLLSVGCKLTQFDTADSVRAIRMFSKQKTVYRSDQINMGCQTDAEAKKPESEKLKKTKTLKSKPQNDSIESESARLRRESLEQASVAEQAPKPKERKVVDPKTEVLERF